MRVFKTFSNSYQYYFSLFQTFLIKDVKGKMVSEKLISLLSLLINNIKIFNFYIY